jgi:hypothetical protein
MGNMGYTGCDPNTVWAAVCRHIEGLAIASTLVGLHRLGVFQRLQAGDFLAPDYVLGSAVPGYGRNALRLLRRMRWLVAETGTDRVALGSAGRSLCRALSAYEALVADSDDRVFEECLAAAELPADQSRLVSDHRDGFRVARLLLETSDQARRLGSPPALPQALAEETAAALRRAGWIEATNAGRLQLSEAGLWAVRVAPQYRHVLCYRPLLQQIPDLLGGTAELAESRSDQAETHIDRLADIRFSGEVYRANCGNIVSQAIAAMPLDGLSHIVDVGAGDGTMLEALYRELAPRAPRLVAVAVEPSLDARAFLKNRFSAADIPHRVLDGDVGNPQEIARQLEAQGLPMRTGLAVMKSVMHDRTIRRMEVDPRRSPRSGNCFIGRGGSALSAAQVEADLVDCLIDWRSVLGPLGMLMVEAHTAPMTLPDGPMRGLLMALDATQGYSHQYLLEAEVHLACCREAGFRVDSRSIGEAMGYPTLTCAWLRPD